MLYATLSVERVLGYRRRKLFDTDLSAFSGPTDIKEKPDTCSKTMNANPTLAEGGGACGPDVMVG